MRAAHGLAPLLTALLLIASSGIVPASATPGDEQWVARYGGGAAAGTGDIVLTSPVGDEVYVVGTRIRYGRRGYPNASEVVVLAYDGTDGSELWRSKTDFGSLASPMSAAPAPDGERLYVAGTLRSDLGIDASMRNFVVALDTTDGDMTTLLTRRAPRVSTTIEMAVAPDGRTVYVAAQCAQSGGGTNIDYYVAAHRANGGRRLWKATYGDRFDDYVDDIAIAPDGRRIFVTGLAANDGTTVAFRAMDGRRVWVDRFSPHGCCEEFEQQVLAGPDGGAVYMVGEELDPQALVVVRYDAATGARTWSTRHVTTDFYSHLDAAIDADGSTVYVTAREGIAPSTGVAVIAVDTATGTERWATSYSTAGDGAPVGIGAGPDGRVYVGAYSVVDTGPYTWTGSYVAIAHDGATGEQLWAATYEEASRLVARGLAISADADSVLVTGTSYEGDLAWGAEAITVAFATS